MPLFRFLLQLGTIALFATNAASGAPIAAARPALASTCPHTACAPPQAPVRPVTCRVTRIIDGDTFVCGEERVRLLMIDAPERRQAPFGRLAREAITRLLPVGSTVRLEHDVRRTDRYGRTLAYVFAANGTFVNEALVRTGYAVPLVIPPNVRHAERIRAAARAAQADRTGLWSVDGFRCLPAEARAGRCE